eukprot:4000294-Amphidinium_carterae.1
MYDRIRDQDTHGAYFWSIAHPLNFYSHFGCVEQRFCSTRIAGMAAQVHGAKKVNPAGWHLADIFKTGVVL